MIKKRIGNTLVFQFELKTNGESVTLDGRDIKLLLRDPRGVTSSLNYRVADGNVIFARFEGKDQKVVGKYSIVVWENKGKTDQAVFDFSAIELVNLSKDEKGNCCDKDFNVEEEVDLGMLDLAVGVQGNGIKSITKQESSESGGVNVYTITLDDGKSVVLNIRNGEKGDPMKFDELSEDEKEQLRGKTGLRGPLVYSASDEPKRNEDSEGSMHEWYFEDIHYSGSDDVDYGDAWVAPIDGHDFVVHGSKLYRMVEMDRSQMPFRYYVMQEADLRGVRGPVFFMTTGNPKLDGTKTYWNEDDVFYHDNDEETDWGIYYPFSPISNLDFFVGKGKVYRYNFKSGTRYYCELVADMNGKQGDQGIQGSLFYYSGKTWSDISNYKPSGGGMLWDDHSYIKITDVDSGARIGDFVFLSDAWIVKIKSKFNDEYFLCQRLLNVKGPAGITQTEKNVLLNAANSAYDAAAEAREAAGKVEEVLSQIANITTVEQLTNIL